MIQDALPMWVIYEHPKDAPNHYVIRKWFCWAMFWPNGNGVPNQTAAKGAVAYETLEQARQHCQSLALTRLAPGPGEDPKIVETWL